MGQPMYDVAVRTSNVTANGALVTLVPPALAIGAVNARVIRLRQVAISNTTATAFGVGLGVSTTAGVTPGGAGTILRRSTAVAASDPASSCACYTTYATQPTVPAAFSARLWVPGNSLVIWAFDNGEELQIPPATTPLPFGVFNLGTGQLADITLTWEE